jgi:signal transduction histidine kinase
MDIVSRPGFTFATQGVWRKVSDEAASKIPDSADPWATEDSDPLVASLLHELRQPLFAIQNFARAARRQLQAGGLAKCDEHLGEIERQVERIQLLSERLRQLARQSLPLRTGHFREIATESVSQLAEWAAAKGVTFDCEWDARPDTIRCEPVLLQQLLLNLIRNSVESLTTSTVPCPKTVRVRSTVQGSRLVVDVIDNGAGIDPADIPKLFVPLFSTKQDGTGIGLSLARRIVTAHQGTIRLHDHRAGQTTFRFELPLALEDSAADFDDAAAGD